MLEETPAGSASVQANGRARLEADTGSGSFVSRLVGADSALSEYTLISVHCDDGASSQAGGGDIEQGSATFRVEKGETVTCNFALMLTPELAACTCPREGRWRVDNHPVSMVCTGAVSMTMPLAPSKSVGTLGIDENSRPRHQLPGAREYCQQDYRAETARDSRDLAWAGNVPTAGDRSPLLRIPAPAACRSS